MEMYVVNEGYRNFYHFINAKNIVRAFSFSNSVDFLSSDFGLRAALVYRDGGSSLHGASQEVRFPQEPVGLHQHEEEQDKVRFFFSFLNFHNDFQNSTNLHHKN